jgi:3D (Asp-Asp-Asp) domain-containing protein
VSETPPKALRPRTGRERRRRNQRIRIAIELLVGGAAIWFVMHPSAFPMLPQPDWAADTLVEDAVNAPSDTMPPGTPPRTPPTAPTRKSALPGALAPKGRLFRSIEERARAGERVAVSFTAYCLQGRTRRGNLVRDGIIAVDRKLFPLGREVDLFIGRRKLGRFLADDTGGVIKGGIIDIWMGDCSAARRFGRRRGYAQLVPRGQ